MSGWLCLVRHQTHLGKAWGSGSLLFSILAKTKESDKWGRRAVKICWLSLAVRDTPRVTWWLRVVSLAFMICCHWLTCSKRTVLAARSKPVVLMRYAAHRIPGYRIAKAEHARRLWSIVASPERANEIKHPVGRVRDIEALDELLATLTDDKPRVIALQPISQKEDATRLCIDTCIARNWRLSMQTHKYLNIAWLNIYKRYKWVESVKTSTHLYSLSPLKNLHFAHSGLIIIILYKFCGVNFSLEWKLLR